MYYNAAFGTVFEKWNQLPEINTKKAPAADIPGLLEVKKQRLEG